MSAGTLLNTTIGAYRLVDFLGAGGMGEVYRAVHVSLGRVVALKVLTAVAADAVSLERFRNEARVHALLQHPHIATLFDFLDQGGRPCIVMEYVDGETLDGVICRAGVLAQREALTWLAAIADAVAYLHDHGIIHRDIKSNNVKISSAGVVKLLDFGIAKASFSPTLTVTGSVIGTIHYLAPEQLAGGTAGPRSDVWALGVLLYEMVTGRMPFEGPRSPADRIARAAYTPASQVCTTVSRDVDVVIGRCLRRRPEDRYASAAGLLADVRGLLAGPLGVAGSAGAGALEPPEAEPWPGWGRPSLRWPSPADWRRLARSRWPLMAAVTAALAALGFLVWALAGPAPAPRPSGTAPESAFVSAVPTVAEPPSAASPSLSPGAPGAPVSESMTPAAERAAPAESLTPAAGSLAPATGPAEEHLQTVRISVRGGPALVYREGRYLNGTPLELQEPVGERVRLVLERAGFQPLQVEFTVKAGTNAYEFELTPLPGRTVPQDPPGGAGLGVLLLPFGWLGRRRRGDRRRPGGGGTTSPVTERVAGGQPALHVDAAALSDPGCVRELNEDAIRVVAPATPAAEQERGCLAVVADGMGGHMAGEIASRLAVDEVVASFRADAGAMPTDELVRAVRRANAAILEAARADPTLEGMGTTCTAIALRGGLACCAHVGDSRLYLVRAGELLQMTEDHSAVMDLVRRGVLTREEARHHPDRNVILRALGSRADVEVAVWPRPFAVRPGDRFVLCTDGLHDLVEEEELLATVRASEPAAACRDLVALARARGAPDNVSVAVLALRAGDGGDAPPAVKQTRVGVEAAP